jgi:hypothetical protein
MKLRLIYTITVFICLASCNKKPKTQLENSLWVNETLDNCTSNIRFTNSTDCLIYYCNFDITYTGKYFINDDTITIQEFHFISEAPGSSDEKEVRHMYKYLLDNNTLKLFYYHDLKYDYTKESFDTSFQFIKKQ